MSVLKFFNHFLNVFFFFGLAPFSAATVRIKLKAKGYLTVLTFSLLNVSVTGFLLYFDQQSFGAINSILTIASLSTGMVLNLSAILQCGFHPSIYQDMICQMCRIERSFREKFSEILPSSSLAKRYRRKAFIIFTFAIMNGFISAFVLWNFLNVDGIPIAVLQTMIRAFSAVVMIHAILYVDIACMYLCVLNVIIKNSPICLYSSRKLELMKNIKLTHMEIWKLVMQINDFFSWSLLAFTINFMINLVYDLYKIFRVLQSEWSPAWTSGKSAFTELSIDFIDALLYVPLLHVMNIRSTGSNFPFHIH